MAAVTVTERRTPGTSGASSFARSPLSVLTAALASFLLALALLTARVVNGTDPAIRPVAQAQVVSKQGHTILRTTASGRLISEPAGQTGSPGAPEGGPASLVTRSSGALAGGEGDG